MKVGRLAMQARESKIIEGKSAVMLDYDAIKADATKREVEKRRKEQLERILEIVPTRFRGKSLDDFHEDYPAQSYIKKIINRYITTFVERLVDGNCLVFHGKPGTGKTMLSLIAYAAIAQAGFTVGYEPTLQFLRIFKEKEFESNAAFCSLLESYTRKSLLIIDEATEGVGKFNFPADWERKMLFALINARYEKQLCTIVITNRNKEEMIARLGEPIVDRLAEKGLFLAFDWNSYRK